MNNKQRVFVEEYLKCWNATEAARRAGYKKPNSQGPRLLVNVGIQKIIQARIEEKCMDADEVLIRLADQARGVPGEYVHASTGAVDFEKLKKAGLLHLVKKIKRLRGSIEVEFYDQQRAMELIGKHLKMWTEKHELSGKDGEPVKVEFIEVIRSVNEE